MNCYIACLGFISYLVLGALAKVTVSVGSDIVVKPTPSPLIDPKDKVDVILNCNGSRSDLSYYIKNRIEWTFIGDDGTSKQYSVGFYLTDGMDRTKFNVLYGKDAPGAGKDGYLTSLSISGVDRSDNGVYMCSLLNESNVIEDSKEVKVTVVNPVEKVTLEIHDSNHKVIRQSSSPLTKKSEVLTMVPGEYMVKCMASGSNPEPVMSLFLNEKKPYVVVDVKEDKTTIFQSFMGSYKLDLTINVMNTEQNLVCKANILGNHYDSVEAGIPLMVKIGALAKVTVSVGSDIVVKPTPSPLIDPKDKVDVILNCNGSRSDLSYYIKNRIEWTFIGDDGTSKQYSVGFYLTDGMDRTKFNVLFGKDAPGAGKDGYLTSLSISGVVRSDNGIYRCSLLNESNLIEDSKEVRLTVANPVETVSLEIHDSNHKVIRQSSSPLNTNSEVLTMTPGVYMVKCDSSGSNPEPVMSLFLNEKKPYVVVDVKENMTTEFQSFIGSYKLDLTINATNTKQDLICKANIPGNHYDPVEAGITLMVKIVTTAAAGMAKPLSLLACLVMAVLSKHIASL